MAASERVDGHFGWQDKFENFFFVVDLHAITVPQDPKQLKAGVFNAAATYLAAGVDPQKSKVFVQVRAISNAIQGFQHHPSPFFKICPMMVFLVSCPSYRLSRVCFMRKAFSNFIAMLAWSAAPPNCTH